MTAPKRIFGYTSTASPVYKSYREKMIRDIEALGYKNWQRTSYWTKSVTKTGILLPKSEDVPTITFSYKLINPIDGPQMQDPVKYEFEKLPPIKTILSDLTEREKQ